MVGLSSASCSNPDAISDDEVDFASNNDTGMKEQQSLSGSLIFDAKPVDVQSWTLPRLPRPVKLQTRINLNEEFPKSISRNGITSCRAMKISEETFAGITTYNAIITGNLEALKEIFKSGQVTHVDRRGNTALHIASKYGQVRSLRWLLLHSHIPLMTKNKRGETCGHLAAYFGHLKCLKAALLFKKEKSLNTVSDRDCRGLTVLHHAAIGENGKSVEWLTKEFGKDVCLMKNSDGAIPLHIAAAVGNKECVQILVDGCQKSANARDRLGATPLFYAAQEGHLDCLRCLVLKGGGDVNVSTNEGVSLPHIAAQRGHVHVLDYLLLKLGDAALLGQSRDGSSVLHFAAGNGHDVLIRRLLKHPKLPQVSELVDVNDSTPAHDAAEAGHVGCLKLLLESGFELFAADKDGETPYSLGLRSTDPRCVMYVRSLTERDYYSEGDVLSGDEDVQPISGVMGIRALSREEAFNFKSGQSVAVTFPSYKKLGRRKMGLVVSTQWPEPDPVIKKTRPPDLEIYGSKERDKPKGKPIRPPKPNCKGIYRGEFILMEAQPLDGMTTRERRNVMSNNGYLYAQKNRPRPITLPFQRNECPARIDQIESTDDLDIDDIDRFNEENNPMVVIQEYNGFRHGSRSGSLDEIKEEEEDLDSASILAFRYNMLHTSSGHGHEDDYMQCRVNRHGKDARATLESQSSGISVFHSDNGLVDCGFGLISRPKLSLSEESGTSGQYDSGCKSSFSSSNSESEDHGIGKGHRHRDSDGFSSFSPESTSSSFRIVTGREQLGQFNCNRNHKHLDCGNPMSGKAHPGKSDSLPSSTSSRDSLGESSLENAAPDLSHFSFLHEPIYSTAVAISPVAAMDQFMKEKYKDSNNHTYQNTCPSMANGDGYNPAVVQIRTSCAKPLIPGSIGDNPYDTSSVAGSDSMYSRTSPNVIHVGDPASSYTTVIIVTSDDSMGNTRIEVQPQNKSSEEDGGNADGSPPATSSPKSGSPLVKAVHFENEFSCHDRDSAGMLHSIPMNGQNSETPRQRSGNEPPVSRNSHNNNTNNDNNNGNKRNTFGSKIRPPIPPPPRINRKLGSFTNQSELPSASSRKAASPARDRCSVSANEEFKSLTVVTEESMDSKYPETTSHNNALSRGGRIKELQQVLMKQANPFSTVIPSKKPPLDESLESNSRPRSTSAPHVSASPEVMSLAARKASLISNEGFQQFLPTPPPNSKRPPVPPPPPFHSMRPCSPLPPLPQTEPPLPPPPPTSSNESMFPPFPPPPPPPPPPAYVSSTLPPTHRRPDNPQPECDASSSHEKKSTASEFQKDTKSSRVDEDTRKRMADIKNMLNRAGTLPSDHTRNYGSLPDLNRVNKKGKDDNSSSSKTKHERRERDKNDTRDGKKKEGRSKPSTSMHRSSTPSERTSASGSSTRSPKLRHKVKKSTGDRQDSLRRTDSPRRHDSPRRRGSPRPKRPNSPRPRTDSPRPREKRRDSPRPRDKTRHGSPRLRDKARSDSPRSSRDKSRQDSPRPREKKRSDSPRPRDKSRQDSPRPREKKRHDSPYPRDKKRHDSPRSHDKKRYDSPRPRETECLDGPRSRKDSPRRFNSPASSHTTSHSHDKTRRTDSPHKPRGKHSSTDSPARRKPESQGKRNYAGQVTTDSNPKPNTLQVS